MAFSKTRLYSFSQTLAFELDPFQREACLSLQAGRGVLVAAPTGAGKTIVGEFAIYLALQRGLKAFYTTPIKALSNQKYTELVAKYGAAQVGLLTGDTSINGDAPVVVMTTEVLRNMLYANSDTLLDLGYVVMDEVHYLADRFRGAVWEEVIIHLPNDVQLVSLSATVSNAEEFGAWLDTVRGDTDVVVSEHRPVPLWQHVMVGSDMFDLFAGDIAFDESGPSPRTGGSRAYEVNPELLKLASAEHKMNRSADWGRSGGRRGRRAPEPPRQALTRIRRASRPQVIAKLDSEGLLPAITFIFSRNGCDAAVAAVRGSGLLLTTEKERAIIAHRVDEAVQDIPAEDLDVLGFWSWRDGLSAGLAAHHAGHAADLQGSGGEALRRRPGQGRLRHRNPRAGRQHAGALRGAGEAGQVQRRGARQHHGGGVHPADRPRRTARHRRRGPRRGALAAGHRSRRPWPASPRGGPIR